MTALEHLRGWVVIDRRSCVRSCSPCCGPRTAARCRLLVLGSASPELVRGASETLAGDVALVSMSASTWRDRQQDDAQTLGGVVFPARSLAGRTTRAASGEDFIRTFLERDLRRFGVRWLRSSCGGSGTWLPTITDRSGTPPRSDARWASAHHGQASPRDPLWRPRRGSCALVRDLGKRQVKSPKIYLPRRPAAQLLGILVLGARSHRLGASWEGSPSRCCG
jgi:hypothetical protein